MTRGLVVALVALAAGCAAPSPSADAELPVPEMLELFSSPSCDEGGGYVVWNPDGLHDERAGRIPKPFEFADASGDLGDPPVTAFGERSRKPLAGAYHVVVSCPTWTFQGVEKTDLLMAFVTGRVLPPPFDPSPLEREYVTFFIAVNDPDLEAAFVALGLAPEQLLSASLSFDNGILTSTMQMDHHGDIISVVPIEPVGAREPETMRLWFMVPVEGGTRAIAIDMVDSAGGTLHRAPSPGHFDHRAPSAAPPAPGAPLHELSSWALGYRDVARSMRAGPVVEELLPVDDLHEGGVFSP